MSLPRAASMRPKRPLNYVAQVNVGVLEPIAWKSVTDFLFATCKTMARRVLRVATPSTPSTYKTESVSTHMNARNARRAALCPMSRAMWPPARGPMAPTGISKDGKAKSKPRHQSIPPPLWRSVAHVLPARSSSTSTPTLCRPLPGRRLVPGCVERRTVAFHNLRLPRLGLRPRAVRVGHKLSDPT